METFNYPLAKGDVAAETRSKAGPTVNYENLCLLLTWIPAFGERRRGSGSSQCRRTVKTCGGWYYSLPKTLLSTASMSCPAASLALPELVSKIAARMPASG